jgi:hypothetical protein
MPVMWRRYMTMVLLISGLRWFYCLKLNEVTINKYVTDGLMQVVIKEYSSWRKRCEPIIVLAISRPYPLLYLYCTVVLLSITGRHHNPLFGLLLFIFFAVDFASCRFWGKSNLTVVSSLVVSMVLVWRYTSVKITCGLRFCLLLWRWWVLVTIGCPSSGGVCSLLVVFGGLSVHARDPTIVIYKGTVVLLWFEFPVDTRERFHCAKLC